MMKQTLYTVVLLGNTDQPGMASEDLELYIVLFCYVIKITATLYNVVL